MKYRQMCINILTNLNIKYTRNFDISVYRPDNKSRIQVMENGKTYGRVEFSYAQLFDCLKLFEDLFNDGLAKEFEEVESMKKDKPP